jgi:hypothetical protein
MLGIVDRADYTGPVKIGIGTEEQHRQLSAIGCERVYSVSELAKGEHDSADPVRMIFRPEDTVVMVQPGIMPLPLMRAVAAMGVAWQVPGHDAVRFASDEDRIAWRQQKPLGLDVPYARKSVGPKPKWPIPTEAQVQLIVKHWHSAQKRAVVVEIVQDMLGADVPDHWVRDQVIKATGSAKRSPQGEGFFCVPHRVVPYFKVGLMRSSSRSRT